MEADCNQHEKTQETLQIHFKYWVSPCKTHFTKCFLQMPCVSILSVFLSRKTQSPSFTSLLCSIFQLLLLITQFRKAAPCDVTEGTDTFPRSVTSPKDKYWPSKHFTLFWSSFKHGGHNKAAVVITRSRKWSFCERLSHRGRNTLLSYASLLLYNQGWKIKTWKWIQYGTSKGIYQTT